MKRGKIGHVVSINDHENCNYCNLEDVVVLTRKEFQQIQRDLEVLEIFKKHIELEKEDSDPYDECAFYEDVLYMNLNLEQDISSDEYEKIKQWLEEQDEN